MRTCGYYYNAYGGTSYRCRGWRGGSIAGVVIGCVVFVVMFFFVFCLFKRGCRRGRNRHQVTQQPFYPPPPQQGNPEVYQYPPDAPSQNYAPPPGPPPNQYGNADPYPQAHLKY